MPDKKEKTPAQRIKANKKIAHTKKLPNTGYGMTSKPLDPAMKAKIRDASPVADVVKVAKKLSSFGTYDPFKISPMDSGKVISKKLEKMRGKK